MGRGPVRERWWQNPRVLLVFVVALWSVQGIAALTLGWFVPQILGASTSIHWANTTYTYLETDTAIGVLATVCLNVMAEVGSIGLIVHIFYGIRADNGPAWALTYFVGIPLAGIGLAGCLRYGLDGTARPALILMAAAGLVLVALPHLVRFLSRRRAVARDGIRASGVTTTGVVRRVGITNRNDIDYWKIWIEYQDAHGNVFHVTHRVQMGSSLPRVGDLYGITYDPAHPGRRSRVVVLGPRTTGARSAHPQGGTYEYRETTFVHRRGPRSS